MLTFRSCDPSPFSSFEEQWGAQLCEAQERRAEEDYEADQLEAARVEFCDLLNDPDFEPDVEDEADLVRWTEEVEPEIVPG